LLARVEELGGSAKAIEAGFFQEEIGRSAYAFQLAVESGKTVIVGLNKFADENETPVIPSPNYATLEAGQVARVRAVRASRDAATAKSALAALAAAAPKVGTAKGELMPLIIAAVRARATVGEISDTLESAWGHYRPG
ncbi:MAG TPA: methylmalonyl-CoA mutase family protein, partial [Gemmatimonadaceae bacterium]|nr:methylmalonyl-CoA mutase family protein [Gemmatimonadaceae bacterium]